MSFLASLIFFTRLPWWRLHSVPKEAFEHVVDWWPLVGWLTGGVMGLVLAAALLLGFPPTVAAGLAIASRMLLTGALHEDGLADFCDGFGGGSSRQRTLDIMKDSHIGSYGVLGLILCIGLLWTSISAIAANSQTIFEPTNLSLSLNGKLIWSAAVTVLLFDVTAKSAASLITGQLPYARTAEGAKNKVVYVGRSVKGWLLHAIRCAVALALPIALAVYLGLGHLCILIPVAFVAELILMWWMRQRLGGYTGDCCGALFLLCELSLYLSLPLL